MATKLGLFNAALLEIGEARLASLTEAREARYVLDDCYDNVLADCLEAGQWNFAVRTVQLAADTGINPNFGHPEIFAKPSDWVRTVGLATDELLQCPLTDFDYKDEVGYWATNVTPIYVAYVSNDASFGLNLTAWPRGFTRFVEVALADRIVLRIAQNSGEKERLETVALPRAKRMALSRDAMNEGDKFRRRSTWNSARGGSGYRDRGSRSSLTG